MTAPGGKLLVAMSGGVDSSVAAALLQQAGHDLIGVTLQLLPCGQDGALRSCCGYESIAKAREVAGQLDIPHYVIDCQAEFDRRVLRASFEEYERGCTPNPCIWCNQRIKFGRLLELGAELGAERLATGHHARVASDPAGPRLLRGRDPVKDQSYFLYALGADQLARAVLPIGELTKERVRELAAGLGLASAQSPESQDACFQRDDQSFSESLRQRYDRPARPGPILDDRGELLGRHPGLHLFTVGQRKGLGVALGRPAWVRSIDPETASLRLTCDPNQLLAGGLRAGQLRLDPDLASSAGQRCQIQIRYRHLPADGRFERVGPDRMQVIFDQPQRAVTPGQAVVLYHGNRVLGGGRIEQVLPVGAQVQEQTS